MPYYYVKIDTLKPILDQADHIDVKTAVGTATLREFIAAMFTLPGWLMVLFRIRGILAKILGLQHGEPEEWAVAPENVAMKPGETTAFFVVTAADENKYWIAEVGADKHLAAWICVFIEPLDGDKKRFHLLTMVKYKHWTGPVYFNIIRPFHHLVVWVMARKGAKARS